MGEWDPRAHVVLDGGRIPPGVFRDHQPSGHRTIRTSAAITLGMIEDLGLLAAAIATVVAAIVRRADGGTPRGRLYPTGA